MLDGMPASFRLATNIAEYERLNADRAVPIGEKLNRDAEGG